MDITKFIVTGRDEALIYGDYSTYRAQLSRKLRSTRKKLGLATRKGAKYAKRPAVAAEDIARNHEYLCIQLLTSERAWAHAMYMKSTHSSDAKGITGAARSHIISRLHKAYKVQEGVLEALSDRLVSGATETDLLEARAYATALAGAEQFEKQSWQACVTDYSIVWAIYTALTSSTKSDIFKGLVTSTVEPSIRYGAYQLKLARTMAIPVIVRKFFPMDDQPLVKAVEKLDPIILKDTSKAKPELVESDAASRTITWRSRTVDLEDASIAVALSAVTTAAKNLSETLSSTSTSHPRERASAYDDILIASQDAVDATKHSIDELVAEGISQGDKRIQSLQITRTAIGYDLISWRIGRNRVLTGDHDGALPDSAPIAKSRKSKQADEVTVDKEEGTGRKLAKLRERVVLYDSTLQSLDSIKELPGVSSDTEFLGELEAKYNYFRALKCLAIARSHSVLSSYVEALSLLARATALLTPSLPHLSAAAAPSPTAPPTLAISPASVSFLAKTLNAELQRHRALVEITTVSGTVAKLPPSLPLVETLEHYPTSGDVDLSNLVSYPTKLEAVPVKPLFFDVAWNYIEYPGRSPQATAQVAEEEIPSSRGEERQEAKKGWFGFGRS
ncbi:hypothetical protein VC83_09442 [Pseudogymnoascus destructans]|uniref:Signal recognition particle subunit SRP68 n=2 Tax=Pseudogymnoascus destructans TaxID=655981 RepID=L8FZQ5_PSED2|nr:uncharacterized protein VC83_09442 [Pseudogymnoascus destructans]ELR06490.1 hypothetical protein GMDG_08014 [Pseudogymnoascus destructans 20631-21]OAF54271.1 hypothetical protein VC83_09442 [Pseudogymnoascus destructans]